MHEPRRRLEPRRDLPRRWSRSTAAAARPDARRAAPGALHLVSDDRLLIADLIRARDSGAASCSATPPTTSEGRQLVDHPRRRARCARRVRPVRGRHGASRGASTCSSAGTPSPRRRTRTPTHVLQRMATVRLHAPRRRRRGRGARGLPPSSCRRPTAAGACSSRSTSAAGITFPVGDAPRAACRGGPADALDAFTGSDRPLRSRRRRRAPSAKIALRRKAGGGGPLDDRQRRAGPPRDRHVPLGFELGDPTRFRLAVGDGALVMPQGDVRASWARVLPSDGAKFTFDVDLSVDDHGKRDLRRRRRDDGDAPGEQVALRVSKVRSDHDRARDRGRSTGRRPRRSRHGRVRTSTSAPPFKRHRRRHRRQAGLDAARVPDRDRRAPARSCTATSARPATSRSTSCRRAGIGVAIDVGPVKGGGFLFFDPPHRTYGGVLEASLDARAARASRSRPPACCARPTTGWSIRRSSSRRSSSRRIEIFLGLTLNGVGGMVGINVAVDVDKLRAGLHDGAIGRLLFPDDPVANAPAIIATMAAVFPHRPGGCVAGPMLQLGWGRRTRSSRSRSRSWSPSRRRRCSLILGPAAHRRARRPSSRSSTSRRTSSASIDFERAVSVVRRLAGRQPDRGVPAHRRHGDAGRARRASSSRSAASTRASPRRPTCRRCGASRSTSRPTRSRRSSAEAYLAVTSNTFQVGLHASLDIDAGAASVHGWLDFDALVQWEPTFHFSIHMDIGLELRVGGHVDRRRLGRPAARRARAAGTPRATPACTSCSSPSTPASRSPGARPTRPTPPPEIDASALVAQALTGAGRVDRRSRPTATRSSPSARSTATGHRRAPDGQLSVRQQAVPLGIPIDAHRPQPCRRAARATVTLTPIAGAPASAPTTGQFATRSSSDLSDDQKLSRPSFEPYQDGVAFGAERDGRLPASSRAPRRTRRSSSPTAARSAGGSTARLLLAHALGVGAIARSGLHVATLQRRTATSA